MSHELTTWSRERLEGALAAPVPYPSRVAEIRAELARRDAEYESRKAKVADALAGRQEFLPVPKSSLLPGQRILVPSTPGFALVTVVAVKSVQQLFGGSGTSVTVQGRGGRLIENVSTHLGDSSHFGDAWLLTELEL